MNCGYSLPKMCLSVGNEETYLLLYERPDGTEINITGSTVTWKLKSTIDNTVVKTYSLTIRPASKVELRVNVTNVPTGSYIQQVEVALQSGDKITDSGMVLVYG